MERDPLTRDIIGAAIEVHRQLGPGLLESVYEEALAYELGARGIPFERQVVVPLIYKGRPLANGLRLDLVVRNRVVVELKSVDRLISVHKAQLLSYLRLSGVRIGLLMNFNEPVLHEGVIRVVYDPPES